VSLDRIFNELELPVDYTTNYYELSASLLKPYQLFVCFRDNRDSMISPGAFGEQGPVTTPESTAGRRGGRAAQATSLTGRGAQKRWTRRCLDLRRPGEAVKDFVAAGNGFFTLITTMRLFLDLSTNYREVQGGVGFESSPLRPFKVRIFNRNHPVTHGVRGLHGR